MTLSGKLVGVGRETRLIRRQALTSVMGKTVIRTVQATPEKNLCPKEHAREIGA